MNNENDVEGLKYKVQAKSVAKELIEKHRVEIDKELMKIHQSIKDSAWTEERAEDLAKDIIEKLIPKLEEHLLNNLKLGVGDATISVFKRALQIVGLFLIAFSFYITGHKWPWN